MAVSQTVLQNLKWSMREALYAAYIGGKEAPYTVPFAMHADLFKFTQAKNHSDAVEVIRLAVDRAFSGL